MIYSTKNNKNTNEDPKTSVVFENLMLLPDKVFWNILKTAAENKGVLPDEAGLLYDNFDFWPKWNPNSTYDTGNNSYVEPDVFFRFEYIDVIVEAKYSDNQGQNRTEWEREFKAYLNKYEDDKKKVVLLAVGGNSSFRPETELKVGGRSCPIVKYSWVNLLNTALIFEKNKLSVIEDENISSMKRIIRNIELGCQNVGIYKYNKKVEIKGLRNLFTLGEIFQRAIKRDADLYSLSYYRENINSFHYGYSFKVEPKDGRRKEVYLSIALWINEQETISIGAKNVDGWADRICKLIDSGKKFTSKSKYVKKPYFEGNCNSYFFDATDKFYQDFSEAQTFDAQLDLISQMIDDVCSYYLK